MSGSAAAAILRFDRVLVLAGPTQPHDGPHEIWRWKGAAKEGSPATPAVQRLLVLPQRENADRAEGLTLLDESGVSRSVLVVYDTPAENRIGRNDGSVTADVFRLP